MQEYSVILVYSTAHAIRAEHVLSQADVSCRLIPVPRHLSSDCGVCLRIARSDREAAGQALQGAGVEIQSVHDI